MRLPVSVFLVFMALASSAQTAEEWIISANNKMSEGNSLGAIKDFTAALEAEPDNAEALAGRGSVHAEVLDFEAAVKDLEKAIHVDSQLALAYFNLGYVYFQMEKYTESLIAYNRFLALQPNDANGYMARGELKLHLGQMEAATDDFRKYVEIPVQEDEDLLGRAKAYVILQKPEDALHALNAYIARRPEASVAYLERADLYLNVFEDYDKAIADYNVYLLEYPGSLDAYTGRGSAYFGKENMRAAIQDYSSAIAIDAMDPDLYMDRGYAYLLLEQYSAALDDFGKALKNGVSDTSTAWYNKGIAEFRLGQKENACNSWNMAGSLAAEQVRQFCIKND